MKGHALFKDIMIAEIHDDVPEPLGPFHQTLHKAHLSEGDSNLLTKLKYVQTFSRTT